MIIHEVFYSLQGEGLFAGMPSVFVRVAGCPLRCRWCDTPQAWMEEAGQEMTARQAGQIAQEYPTWHMVFTGGEPMVHPDFPKFLTAFAEPQMHITIETSGIKFVPDLPCDLMSISPKLANTRPIDPETADRHERIRFSRLQLQQLLDQYTCQLKFVVDTSEDVDEIARCIEILDNVNPDMVYLMPQATNTEQLLEKSRWLAEVCKKTGFALSSRLQALLWGNRKGT